MIKERWNRHCVIREPNYDNRLSKFIRLFEEAKQDFPTLKAEDVNAVKFGGVTYRGTFGIEFTVPEGTEIPAAYKEVHQLEKLL